jgi:hypothetical protein
MRNKKFTTIAVNLSKKEEKYDEKIEIHYDNKRNII